MKCITHAFRQPIFKGTDMPLTIRTMNRKDLDLASQWARLEGWNPGLDDADAFFATDPEGFLIGELNGEPACVISVVRYGEHYGFLGFYICAPKFRGGGHGLAIWQAGMEQLTGRIVGLDGVIDQQDNYRKSGFALAHRNIRYSGELDLDPPAHTDLRPVDLGLIPALIDHDQKFNPAPRDRFLSQWLEPAVSSRHSFALERGGSIAGFGTIRACHDGHKIGPLFATTETDADLLFRALCATVGKTVVFLDVPEPNQAAVSLAKRYGLTSVFETARMYRGKAPSLPLQYIWGITTFELG
jgi:hypothetical protein